MCCTFGDQTDVTWWNKYNLPLVEAIDRQGHMSSATIMLARAAHSAGPPSNQRSAGEGRAADQPAAGRTCPARA
jgi:hypothetical protein